MSAKKVKLTFGKRKTHLAHQATLNLLVAGFDVEVAPITITVSVPTGALSSAQAPKAPGKIAEGFQGDGVQAEIIE